MNKGQHFIETFSFATFLSQAMTKYSILLVWKCEKTTHVECRRSHPSFGIPGQWPLQSTALQSGSRTGNGLVAHSVHVS